MRIIKLSSYFYPESVASSYLGETVREAYAHAGIETVVYVPTPSRGVTDEQRQHYKKNPNETQLNGMLHIRRFSLWKEGKNPLGRALRYFVQCVKLYFLGVYDKDAKSASVITSSSTPPILGITAGLIKKRTHKAWVYDLQDIFPDSLVGTGMTHKGSLLWKIGRVIEKFTYKHADKIIVISKDFKENLLEKGVPEEKIEVIYNWVDENAVHPVSDDENPLFEEFDVSKDKFRVVYAGNFGNAQNIGIILDAAARMKDNDKVEFILFGKGGMEDEIRGRILDESLTNVKLLPLQPFDRVSYVYSLGNVCVVTCKPGLGGAAMPSKTWSVMSAGRAVLANFDEGELKAIVEGHHCGVFTKAGDLEGFVAGIENLMRKEEECEEMGRNGRKFILQNLTKEIGTKKYVNIIKSFEKE